MFFVVPPLKAQNDYTFWKFGGGPWPPRSPLATPILGEWQERRFSYFYDRNYNRTCLAESISDVVCLKPLPSFDFEGFVEFSVMVKAMLSL